MAAESIEDLFARYGPAYKWFASVTCMLGAMTMVLSQTTVNVAFPDIMGAFGIGRDEAQWLSSGFFAAMTAGMLLQAWLVSIFGERVAFLGTLLHRSELDELERLFAAADAFLDEEHRPPAG